MSRVVWQWDEDDFRRRVAGTQLGGGVSDRICPVVDGRGAAGELTRARPPAPLPDFEQLFADAYRAFAQAMGDDEPEEPTDDGRSVELTEDEYRRLRDDAALLPDSDADWEAWSPWV